jgi:hypothetical protein
MHIQCKFLSCSLCFITSSSTFSVSHSHARYYNSRFFIKTQLSKNVRSFIHLFSWWSSLIVMSDFMDRIITVMECEYYLSFTIDKCCLWYSSHYNWIFFDKYNSMGTMDF